MSKLKADQILKSDVTLDVGKLKDKRIDKFLKETKEKQDRILNLKVLDEKTLKLVVQL
jgi:hypothetical protein